MNIEWTFRNCDSDKQRAQGYFRQKIPRLKRRLARFGVHECRISLTLHHHPNRNAWELRAVLKLPASVLVTGAEQSSLTEVIDEVIDDLTRQLRRHKARVRKEHVLRRRRRRGRDFVTALSYLEQDVAQDRREEFFALLSPLLENVREHAEYELALLESENVVPIGEFSVDDLVDDVLLLAYDRFKLRPPESLLEAWLMGLLHERTNALTGQLPPLSLTPPAKLDAETTDDSNSLDLEDVNYWMSHVFDCDEPVGLEELLPDDHVASSLDKTDEETSYRKLRQFLNKLPRRQRQAIMLHEASGFEIPEIAKMLDVSDEQVEDLIDRAREALRKNLAEFGSLQEPD